ncbi:putative zinc binding protein [Thermolongibacillus altinsuensis]|uniref:Putative zinc binding protein n=1 Tax=Thermolongibacillus altinsuensis TaxID=575256 RepID=A0A4V2QA32_9BACL|nr:class I SAM-dependent methyltransferase [Thermolongibacillus altinsuensis]TCL47677.1 putative zinc binding protein [Thermolongibacillus altinsuensis]
MSNYHCIEVCRACQSDLLFEIYKKNDIPIAGIYTNQDNYVNIHSPITIMICEHCRLVQLKETIDSSVYTEYHFVGNSSSSYEFYLNQLARQLVEQFYLKEKDIFEIGASNGVLLKYLRRYGENNVFGIEPSIKLCEDAKGFDIHLDQGYFDRSYVNELNNKYDCVIIRHVLEHIDHLREVIFLISEILKDDGIVVVEVPSINEMVRKRNYSNVFHEHLNYFSEQTLNYLFTKIGFEPFFTKNVDIHGGAIFSVYKKAQDFIKVTNETAQVEIDEIISFFVESDQYYKDIRKIVLDLIEKGKTVHGFGASHRTFTILGYANLDKGHIPYIYDNNSLLHGKVLNGFGNVIVSPTFIQKFSPDAIVIFATSYEKEIREELKNKYGYKGEIISIRQEVVSK